MSLEQSHTGHVLAAYAESCVVSAAVIFIGDVTSGIPTQLLAMGARTVHAFDRDGARARAFAEESPRGIVVRPLPHKFEVRDSAFDVALVVDMADSPDPEALAKELARLVTPEGVVVAATANADSIGDATRAIPYEAFYDMFAVGFEHVRVVAEIAWRGVALAELGERDEDPAVTVDSQLAPEPPTPSHFVIVASQVPSALDSYALFQLPEQEEEPALPAELRRPEEELGERRISVQVAAAARAEVTAAMASELAEARLRADVLASQLEQQRAHSQRLESSELRFQDERSKREEERAKREAEHAKLLEERAKNERIAQELARLSELVVAAQAETAAAESRSVAAEARSAAAEARSSGAQAQIAAAENRVRELEQGKLGRLAELEAAIERSADEHAQEIARSELMLRERARAVVTLEREVARRERLVRELVASLEEAHTQATHTVTPRASMPAPSPTIEPPPMMMQSTLPDVETTRKLEAMALELARYEGELLARDWRIAELEQNLAIAESSLMMADRMMADRVAAQGGGNKGSAAAIDAKRLGELETEIDTLRQALAQEHEARKHAESAHGVDDLRAALAEKMTLIEQLSARLSASS